MAPPHTPLHCRMREVAREKVVSNLRSSPPPAGKEHMHHTHPRRLRAIRAMFLSYLARCCGVQDSSHAWLHGSQ